MTEDNKKYKCTECGCEQTYDEMIYDENYDFDYSYSCKSCGGTMESNGRIYCEKIEI